MLKLAVLIAVTVCAVQAQRSDSKRPAPPTPDPNACKIEYLKDIKLCGNVPEVISEDVYKTCMKKIVGQHGPPGGPPGGRQGGPPGGRQGGRQGGPPGIPGGLGALGALGALGGLGKGKGGEGPMNFMKMAKGGKGGKAGKMGMGPGGKPPGPPPGCFNCVLECVFDSSQLLDDSGSVDIAVVKEKFVAKAANAAWAEIINTSVDSCWKQVQDAPAPVFPAPPAGAPAPPAEMKKCKHHPLFLMQCVQRAILLNTPEADRLNTAGDCDARIEHLNNCDPMVLGWIDFAAMMRKAKGGKGKKGGGNVEEMVGKIGARLGKKKGGKMMKN